MENQPNSGGTEPRILTATPFELDHEPVLTVPLVELVAWECDACFHIYTTNKHDIGDCPYCEAYGVES